MKRTKSTASTPVHVGPITTIVFEDHGQDFTEWDIQNGVIVESRLFQTGTWFGRIVMNESDLKPGNSITLDGGTTIKYPIVEVIPNRPVENPLDQRYLSQHARDLINTSVDDVRSSLSHMKRTSEPVLRETLAYLANHNTQTTKFKMIKAFLLRRNSK